MRWQMREQRGNRYLSVACHVHKICQKPYMTRVTKLQAFKAARKTTEKGSECVFHVLVLGED